MNLALYAPKPLYRNLQHKPLLTTLLKDTLLFAALVLCLALVFVEPALAGGTGTGGVGAAQARINTVTTGWQTIVTSIGIAILIIAWSVIGYQIAFNGKTMKDMLNPAMGSTIAGLAPVLVGWMFS
jgi:uncharacterized membrane protein